MPLYMTCPRTRLARRRESGFTMIEAMITVAIVAILASVAIPLFKRHQLVSKTAESKTNLASLRVAEEARYSEQGEYVPAAPEPATIPGNQTVDFDTAGSDFRELGWSPEGRVYFSYGVSVSADLTGYTADAGADIDQDGIVQIWGYAKPDAGGSMVAGSVGCDVSFLSPTKLGRCSADESIY